MRNWIGEHPYLTGGFVIGAIVLYFVFRSSGTGTAQAQTATGLSAQELAIQAQNAQLSAASQAHTQDLQTALAAKQIDASVAQSQIDAALTAKQLDAKNAATLNDATIAGQLKLAGIQKDALGIQAGAQLGAMQAQFSYQSAATGSLAGRDVSIAGIQGDVAKAGIDAQLQAQKDTNKTAAQIAALNANVSLHGQDIDLSKLVDTNATARAIATTNAGVVTHVSDNQLAGLYSNNQLAYNVANLQSGDTRYLADVDLQKWLSSGQTQIDVANINAGTQQLAITTQGDVYNHAIQAQADTQQLAITTQGQVDLASLANDQKILDGLNAGVFNKGGEGGANQVSVVGAITGQPSVGAPAQAVQSGNTAASWLDGIANIGTAIFGG